jgi:hypothetical protein
MQRPITLDGIKPHDLPIVKVVVPYYNDIPVKMVQLIQMIHMTGIPGYHVFLAHKGTTIIPFGRSECIDEPEGVPYDYLLSVDSDMGLEGEEFRKTVAVLDMAKGKMVQVIQPIAMMKQLLDHRVDIVGGICVQRGKPHMPCVFKYVNNDEQGTTWTNWVNCPVSGMHEVDAIGTAFLCVHKRVFEAFKERNVQRHEAFKRYRQWLRLHTFDDLPAEVAEYLQNSRIDIAPPFWVDYLWDSINAKWGKTGEDIYFCHEAKKLGFKVYCDFDVKIGHQSSMFVTIDHFRYAYQEEQIKDHTKWAAEHGIDSPALKGA